jgi:hypothetical protein
MIRYDVELDHENNPRQSKASQRVAILGHGKGRTVRAEARGPTFTPRSTPQSPSWRRGCGDTMTAAGNTTTDTSRGLARRRGHEAGLRVRVQRPDDAASLPGTALITMVSGRIERCASSRHAPITPSPDLSW